MKMMNLTNMRLGKRLGLGFGILAAIIAGASAMAWWGSRTASLAMGNALEESAKMRTAQVTFSRIQDVYLHLWNIAGSKDMVRKQELKAEVGKLRESYKKGLDELKAMAKSDEGKQMLGKIEEAVGASRDLNNQVVDLGFKGKEAEALTLYAREGMEKMKKVNQAFDDFISWRERRMIEARTEAEAVLSEKVRGLVIVSALIALAIAVIFGRLITRSISIPVQKSSAHLAEMAKGDFSIDVSPHALKRRDEMGDIARAISQLNTSMKASLSQVIHSAAVLASSATELSAISGQTASGVKGMSEKTSTVAAAAEEASANTNSVAASIEEASTNLGSVASATEEMSATVGEIASNSEKGRAISEQATAQAQAITSLMQQLGDAAREIGKVTETITDISSQTNLLALNATIEAARAGAAGKGFAVVANEIKELARQTAAATEDIKAKIAGVQTSTGGAIADIEKITGVIKEVGSIVSTIAAAIEEQATVTKDVAGNIAQASAGVKDANERVAQTATVSKSIASDIASVNAAVGDIRQGGEQVQASAGELSKLAEQLKAAVGKFKV
jgi:methyl-accepting chemotaxis protein